MTSAAVTTLAALLSAAGCSQPQAATLGSAIADSVDPLNGIPTVVVDGYFCESPGNRCPVSAEAAIGDERALSAEFAAHLEVPLVDAAGFQGLQCPWSRQESDSSGLYAWFMHPPASAGDSVKVELMSGCTNGTEAFYQTHDFVLKRDGAGWRVVRRSQTSVS